MLTILCLTGMGGAILGLTGPIIAVLVLHETVTWIGVAGILLVISGMVAGILLVISGMVLGTLQGPQKTPADAA